MTISNTACLSEVNLYMLNFHHLSLSLSLLGGCIELGGEENGKNFLPVSLVEWVAIHSTSQEYKMIDANVLSVFKIELEET